jgi:hypothetical protein
MDIYCSICGEPWDHDSLHEFGDYQKRVKAFKVLGCGAFSDENIANCDPCNVDGGDNPRILRARILQQLSDCSDDWIDD